MVEPRPRHSGFSECFQLVGSSHLLAAVLVCRRLAKSLQSYSYCTQCGPMRCHALLDYAEDVLEISDSLPLSTPRPPSSVISLSSATPPAPPPLDCSTSNCAAMSVLNLLPSLRDCNDGQPWAHSPIRPDPYQSLIAPAPNSVLQRWRQSPREEHEVKARARARVETNEVSPLQSESRLKPLTRRPIPQSTRGDRESSSNRWSRNAHTPQAQVSDLLPLTKTSYRPSSDTLPFSSTMTLSALAMDDSRCAARMTVIFCSRMMASMALFTCNEASARMTSRSKWRRLRTAFSDAESRAEVAAKLD